MTVELHDEAKALIDERMSSGRFASVEEALLDCLRVTRMEPKPAQSSSETGLGLVELLAPFRGAFTDEEIDRAFARPPSYSRDIDLS